MVEGDKNIAGGAFGDTPGPWESGRQTGGIRDNSREQGMVIGLPVGDQLGVPARQFGFAATGDGPVASPGQDRIVPQMAAVGPDNGDKPGDQGLPQPSPDQSAHDRPDTGPLLPDHGDLRGTGAGDLGAGTINRPSEHTTQSDSDQDLQDLGIPQKSIDILRDSTRHQRKSAIEPSEMAAAEITGGGLFSGDYQQKLEGIRPLYTVPPTITTTKVQERKLLGPRTITETREIVPVNVASEVVAHARNLLESGEPTVNIVDFGAGGARTMRDAAAILEDEIREGRVSVTATNINGVPNPDSLRDLGELLPSVRPIVEGLVKYDRADILELRDRMQGKPIHLLFMVDTFPFTREFNDATLRIAADLVHPERGTAVLGFGTLLSREPRHLLTRDYTDRELIDDGLGAFAERNFRNVDPWQVGEGEVDPGHVMPGIIQPTYKILQAPNAPNFSLFKAGETSLTSNKI